MKCDIRHEHEQLLICIAFKLRISIEPLLPCLFDNLSTGVGLTLVESPYVVKVDLFPYQSLESWFCLVAVVVTMVMAVIFMIMTRMVVLVMVRHVVSLWRNVYVFERRKFGSRINSFYRFGFNWSTS